MRLAKISIDVVMAAYRAVLEVLKFSEEQEVLQAQEAVSQTWRQAAQSDELWLCFIYEDKRLECGYKCRTKRGREQYKYLHYLNTCLVTLTYEEIRFFHCPTGRIVRSFALSESIFDISNSAQVLLWDFSLLITGGGIDIDEEHHRKAFRLLEGRIYPVANLPIGRRCHGISLWADSVFVFGGLEGRSGCSDSVHEYSFSESLWRSAPSMLNSRARFCPVTYQAQIYLCGGLYTYDSEVFDPATHIYTPLPFSLPEVSDSACVFHSGCLIIATNAFLARWTPGEVGLSKLRRSDHSCVYGPMNAVALHNSLYILGFEGLICININKATSINLAQM